MQRDQVIQEGFLDLDEKAQDERVPLRGGEPLQGPDILTTRQQRQVLDDPRTDIAEVDLIDAKVPNPVIPANVCLDHHRCGFGWILLQGRLSGRRLPCTNL